jgi:signal transduction histidine kinase
LWLAVRESASRLEKVENFSLIFLIVGLLGSFITVILGWIAARSITQPINKLIKFSSEIGKGNLKFNSPEGFHGEIGVLAATMDIMRNEILNNQKEKENILAQIAHEIRNPLGGIELLANLTKEDLVKEQKDVEYLDKILDEINKLKSLISSYLNYSRPVPSSPDWIELDKIYDDIRNIFKSRICDKKIKLAFNGNLKSIYFDPIHLRNVLVNLVSNSLEAIKDNGMVVVKSEAVGTRWAISVTDNGPGIQPENISRVFEPFFTTRKDGTGLGLAISKKLCEENNAALSVKLNQTGGCVFTISKEIIYDKK